MPKPDFRQETEPILRGPSCSPRLGAPHFGQSLKAQLMPARRSCGDQVQIMFRRDVAPRPPRRCGRVRDAKIVGEVSRCRPEGENLFHGQTLRGLRNAVNAFCVVAWCMGYA